MTPSYAAAAFFKTANSDDEFFLIEFDDRPAVVASSGKQQGKVQINPDELVNTVAREEPDIVLRWAKAVASAVDAQSATIGGGSGASFREATAELRTATGALVTAAVAALGGGEADASAGSQKRVTFRRHSPSPYSQASHPAGARRRRPGSQAGPRAPER